MSIPAVVPPIASLSTRARYGHILAISLPIIAALTSQNLLNIVDTWIVGRLGSLALAAVALSSTINWVASSFFIGLGSGVQALVSRRIGEDDPDGAIGALNRSLLFALYAVVPLGIVASSFADVLLGWVTTDPDVHLAGTSYLAARLAGLPFLAANYGFRGYWNGLGMSRVYLRTLIFIHVVNVVVSYVLVFGTFGAPEMGVFGAGVGSTLSQALGTCYYAYLASRLGASEHFMSRRHTTSLRGLMKLGTPAGFQTLLFSTGFLIFFMLTDQLGHEALGASQVLVTMALVSILPAVGFGMGAASLVGQSLGAGRPEDARTWGWLTLTVGCVVVGSIGAIESLTAGWWMNVFVPTDPAAAALGTPALRIIGGIMVLDAVGVILSNTLVGAGAAKKVLIWSVACQYGVFLPGAWLLGLHLGYSLVGMWAAFAVYRVLFGIATVRLWAGDSRQKVDV